MKVVMALPDATFLAQNHHRPVGLRMRRHELRRSRRIAHRRRLLTCRERFALGERAQPRLDDPRAAMLMAHRHI